MGEVKEAAERAVEQVKDIAECEVSRAEKVVAPRLVGVLRARQTVCSMGYAPSIQATSSFQGLSFSLYTGGSEVPLPMAWGGVQATPA